MILNKRKNIFLLLTLFIVGVFALPLISSAQILVPQIDNLSTGSVEQVAGSIIQIFLGLLGLIALVIVIYAGFKWMTSAGNEEKISQAKKMLMAGVIGLIIILASYIITSFILDAIQGSSGSEPSIQCNPGDCVSCHRVCNSGGDGTYYNPDACGSESLCNTGGTTKHDFFSTWHSPQGNDISLCAMVQIGFNNDVNEDTVVADNFGLYECGETTVCTVADVTAPGNTFVNLFDSDTITVQDNIVQFVYEPGYQENTHYLVYLSQFGIENTEESPLANAVSWNFRTGTDTDYTPPIVDNVFPEDDATDVCLGSHIRATFSEDMDVLSLKNEDAFHLYLDNGSLAVNGDLTDLTFNHQINNSRTVLFNPDSFYGKFVNYFPVLNSNVIKDVCGNYLDGDGNGDVNDPPDNSPDNDFPPGVPPQAAWDFTTGENEECTPEVTDISPEETYYDGDYLTINGNYLDGAVLTFNNELIIDNESTFCIGEDSDDNWPNELCRVSNWTDNQIEVYVPSTEGFSNGALSGDIIVTTPQGHTNTSFGLLSPRINDIFPDEGGPGQYVSVLGQNFGEDQDNSKIYFRQEDTGSLVESYLPCDSSWSDDNIIISVNPLDPDNILEPGFWRIQVKKMVGSEEYWSNLGDFYITDEEAGPGLCPIEDNTFKVGDEFSLNGIRLGNDTFENRKVILGDDNSFKEARFPVWNLVTAPDQSIDVTVEIPFMGAGNNVGVRVVTQEDAEDLERFSNYVQLNIEADTSSAFRITSTTPISATSTSYVTIYGSGFENDQENKEVWFRIGSGTDDWTKGDDESFSSVCAAASWSDSRVVIKVPTYFNYLSPGEFYTSEIKIVDLDDEGHITDQTNPLAFTVGGGGPAPAICGLDSEEGTQGDSIEVYGEYFENPDVEEFYFNAIFNSGNDFISGTEASSLTINSDEKLTVKVPATETGLLVASAGINYGNTWNFEYLEIPIDPDDVWDFYGWEFRTCVDCERPRVRIEDCETGQFSPSPDSGNRHVPMGSNIYVVFEYPSDGTLAEMNGATLTKDNFILSKCGHEDDSIGTCNSVNQSEYIIPDYTNTTFALITDFVFESSYWYQIELTSAVKDIEGSSLEEYSWYFRIDPSGVVCVPDDLYITPSNHSTKYAFEKHVDYSGLLINTTNCYVCSNVGYDYKWMSSDITLVSSFDPDLANVFNPAAVLNSFYDIGSLEISATATTSILEYTDTANLTIIANCAFFNDSWQNCINSTAHQGFDCCWDSAHDICVNDGSPVCFQPFVKNLDCIEGGFGQAPQLGSPSPMPDNEQTFVDSLIRAEFTNSYGNVTMATTTYLNGLEIYRCNNGDVFDNGDCDDSIEFSENVSSYTDSMVEYGHNIFDADYWYKIKLTTDIQDIYGYELQEDEIWHFRVIDDTCEVNAIEVAPANYFMNINNTKQYSTSCYGENCNVCENIYSYDWESNNYSIATTTPGTDITNMVTALNSGFAQITATTIIPNVGELSDYGNLTVSTPNCSNITDCDGYGGDGCCPTDCTCANDNDCCENSDYTNPRVREEACGSNYSSSPSPYPNNENVPIDPIIYVEFEYPNGGSIAMASTTLISDNVGIYKCENGASHGICNILPLAIGSLTTSSDSLSFPISSNLTANFWYKVELSTDITDDQNIGLIPNNTAEDAYEWYFRVNSSGYVCDPDTVGVNPNNLVVPFSVVAGYSRVYTASLWDSSGCYACDDNGYIYFWSGDPENIITVNSSSISTTTVNVGETWDSTETTTTTLINASASDDGTNSISGDTSLTIEKDTFGFFNILSKYPEDVDSDICPNTLIKVEFDESLDINSLENNIILSDESGIVATTYFVYTNFDGEGILNIYIEDLLATSTEYAVGLTGGSAGIKSIHGNVLDCSEVGSCDWSFTTADTICDLNYVKIVGPAEDYYEFNTPDTGIEFIVEGRTISGNPIVSIADVYDWSWYWESLNEDLVVLEPSQIYQSNVMATAENANGETKIKINALPIPSESMCSQILNETQCLNGSCCWVEVEDGEDVCTAVLDTCETNLTAFNAKAGYKGGALSDEIEVTLFMCENPWEYTVDYSNFKLKYCMDGGLPYLNDDPIIRSQELENLNAQEVADGLLREYIFTYDPDQQVSFGDNNLADARSEKSMFSEIGISELTDNRLGFNLIVRMFKGLVGDFFNNFNNKVLAAAGPDPDPVIEVPNDIIGVRIYQNQNHQSASNWYNFSDTVDFKGSPSSIKIDDYKGLRDGRSTYVNFANKNADDEIHTNISLISYNQDASFETTNIYNQLIDNWKFNTNIISSDKDLLIDDVRRWENIRDIEKKLDNYASRNKYCAYVDPADGNCYHFDINGDGVVDEGECYDVSQTVTCNSDTQCQNHDMSFDKCVEVYPELNEGTYVQGVSTSKWPSWVSTLGNELGSALPVDPINDFHYCTDPYNEETCWDEIIENFSCPMGAEVYYYQAATTTRALSFDLYSLFNFNFNEEISADFWQGINSALKPYNYLDITNSICDGEVVATCGDGSLDPGEGCEMGYSRIYCPIVNEYYNYNPTTVGCRMSDCQWYPRPEPCQNCGDGFVNGVELCDGQTLTFCENNYNPQEVTCNSTCNGWNPNLQACQYCGDGICEAGYGETNITCYADCASCGNGICESSENAYSCYADCGDCGDAIVSGPEVCDFNISIGEECFDADGYPGHYRCANGCNGWEEECSADGECGDEIVNGNELCEIGDIGPQCTRDNGYFGNRQCNSNTCVWIEDIGQNDDIWCPTDDECGDGTVNGPEDCEPGDTLVEACEAANQYWGDISNCIEVGEVDECRWNCIATQYCGDGTVNGPEDCEIGNTQSCGATPEGYAKEETCRTDCMDWENCIAIESCGDGEKNGDEDCDYNEDPVISWDPNTGEICNESCDIVIELKILQVFPHSSAVKIEPIITTHVSDPEFTQNMASVTVTEIHIDDFNIDTNYNTHLPPGDRLANYNLVIFGWYDCNNHKDLTSGSADAIEGSADAIEDFIDSGGAVIFGHDTFFQGAGCGGTHASFNSLMSHAGVLGIGNWSSCSGAPAPGAPPTGAFNGVIKNTSISGELFQIPYILPPSFPVLNTHVTCQVLDDSVCTAADGLKIWYYDDDGNQKPWANTCGKVEMIQLGHSVGTPYPNEQKALINMLYYVATRDFGSGGSVCGNGIPETGEECDDGNTSNTDSCLNDCTDADCGDNYVWSGNEECDDGNTSNTDSCLNDCTDADCGDNYVWSGNEQCDDGNLVPLDGCDENCDIESSVVCNSLNTENWDGFYYTPDGNTCETLENCHCVSWGECTCEDPDTGQGGTWPILDCGDCHITGDVCDCDSGVYCVCTEN